MLKRTTGLKKGNKLLKKSNFRKAHYSPIKPRKKTIEEIEEAVYQVLKMGAFFEYCLREKGNRSEVSNVVIYSPGSINYHHLFEKNENAYPELKYSLMNILTVTADEHTNIHNDMSKYPIVKERMEYIRQHWEEAENQSLSWSEEYDSSHKLDVHET